ncbi:MAG: DEAD/DEAH box helicase family protein [Methanobrevibacter sp.]|jgi:type III restriction enzyme|nr:DEAD/DEAH box helicase family protein [Candidatus Methanovirga meridionalis]
MSNVFLHENLDTELGKKNIVNLPIDDEIISNLNPKFPLRNYQINAFQYFKSFYEEDLEFKKNPISVLFNMATGSGKTLIMAGLILYLYKKGYRNFLFFVNSNNIIEKTKDNFLNYVSDKYLFNKKITMNGNIVNISEVNNYQGVNSEDINICFATIQKLHSDLNTQKENSITFEDFKYNKIVLIADEAHHGLSKTKNETLTNKPNWENTIEKIFQENRENILLEFTATIGIENEAIYKKYLNRLLYKYDLKSFVKDKYSKNIEIFKVDGDKKYRMLSAIIINQYRQDLANKHGINHFKPVILFKAIKEIKESHENHAIFRDLVDNLNQTKIGEIKEKSTDPLIKKIFDFYEKENFSINNLIKKIKVNFSEKKCLNVNEKDLNTKTAQKDKKIQNELITQQFVLNNLESKNNPIRVIFAVKKLDEGWDVLNLFDIVRLSDKKVSKGTKGSTVSEAQLIGRGARYFPFKLDDSQEKYKRKYDYDTENDLRILEELYFHSYDGSHYISELKDALIKDGLLDNRIKQKKLKLKDSFKETKLYKTGKIFINDRSKRKNYGLNSFNSLKYFKEPFSYKLYSGGSEKIEALKEDKNIKNYSYSTNSIKLNEIETHVIRSAMAKIDFFNFKNLKLWFPEINSSTDIIYNNSYLNNMIIDLNGLKKDLDNLNNKLLFNAVYNLLIKIKDEIKHSTFEYSATEFSEKPICEIFSDKTLNINIDDPRFDGCEEFLKSKEWYVFNANYGTNEEKACVKFIDKIMESNLNKEFDEIYLIRNELFFKIYSSENGEAFAPDFVLFMKDKLGVNENYQLFIEPKGEYIAQKDSWKEEFLKKIFCNKEIIKYDEKEKYNIIGLPFFNSGDENSFREIFFDKLNVKF